MQYLLGIGYTWNKATLAVLTRNRLHLQYLLGIGYTWNKATLAVLTRELLALCGRVLTIAAAEVGDDARGDQTELRQEGTLGAQCTVQRPVPIVTDRTRHGARDARSPVSAPQCSGTL